MKSNKIIKSVALSSLLVASLAGTSVFANPIDETSDAKPSSGIEGKAAFTTITAVQMADPLELAAKYAQDTLDDWKNTLTQYDEALKSKWNFSEWEDGENRKFKTIQGVAAQGEVGLDRIKIERDDLKIVPRPNGELVNFKEISAKIAEKGSGGQNVEFSKTVTVEASDKDSIQLDDRYYEVVEAAPLESITVLHADEIVEEGEEGVRKVTAMRAMEASPTTKALFEARMNLDKAAQTGDAAEIRTALAELLDLYKQEIANLTAVE